MYATRIKYTHLCICKPVNQISESKLDRDLCVLNFLFKIKKEEESTVCSIADIHVALKKGVPLRHTIHGENSSPLMLDCCSVVHGIERHQQAKR